MAANIMPLSGASYRRSSRTKSKRGSGSLWMTKIKPGGKLDSERSSATVSAVRLHFDPYFIRDAAEACVKLVQALEFVAHVMPCHSSP
jgi:hypothetical protein